MQIITSTRCLCSEKHGEKDFPNSLLEADLRIVDTGVCDKKHKRSVKKDIQICALGVKVGGDTCSVSIYTYV